MRIPQTHLHIIVLHLWILEDISSLFFRIIFRITIFFGKPNSIRSPQQTVASLKACNNIEGKNIYTNFFIHNFQSTTVNKQRKKKDLKVFRLWIVFILRDSTGWLQSYYYYFRDSFIFRRGIIICFSKNSLYFVMWIGEHWTHIRSDSRYWIRTNNWIIKKINRAGN